MGDYKFFEENAETIVFQGRVIVKKKKVKGTCNVFEEIVMEMIVSRS